MYHKLLMYFDLSQFLLSHMFDDHIKDEVDISL